MNMRQRKRRMMSPEKLKKRCKAREIVTKWGCGINTSFVTVKLGHRPCSWALTFSVNPGHRRAADECGNVNFY